MISALVFPSIVPINPPIAASAILSSFKLLSLISHFKAEFSSVPPTLPVAFNVLAKSGSFVLDAFSAMLNGIVLLKLAFTESALNNGLVVDIEYLFASVPLSSPNVPA